MGFVIANLGSNNPRERRPSKRDHFKTSYLYFFYFSCFFCFSIFVIQSWRWGDVLFASLAHFFFPKGVIDELPHLLWIWQDPKADNTMYCKDLLKDWSLDHFEDFNWYIECPWDCTLLSKITFEVSHDPDFQEKLASFGGSNIQVNKKEYVVKGNGKR